MHRFCEDEIRISNDQRMSLFKSFRYSLMKKKSSILAGAVMLEKPINIKTAECVTN